MPIELILQAILSDLTKPQKEALIKALVRFTNSNLAVELTPTRARSIGEGLRENRTTDTELRLFRLLGVLPYTSPSAPQARGTLKRALAKINARAGDVLSKDQAVTEFNEVVRRIQDQAVTEFNEAVRNTVHWVQGPAMAESGEGPGDPSTTAVKWVQLAKDRAKNRMGRAWDFFSNEQKTCLAARELIIIFGSQETNNGDPMSEAASLLLAGELT